MKILEYNEIEDVFRVRPLESESDGDTRFVEVVRGYDTQINAFTAKYFDLRAALRYYMRRDMDSARHYAQKFLT